jgi:hypothetical protein
MSKVPGKRRVASRRILSVRATNLIAIFLLFSATTSWAELIVGIEIGGSGVKAFIYEAEAGKVRSLSGDEQAARFNGNRFAIQASSQSVGQARDAENRITRIASELSDQVLSESVITAIARDVAYLASLARLSFGVSAERIYIYGSSAVEKSRNLDILMRQLDNALKRERPNSGVLTVKDMIKTGRLGFVSAEQEGVFSLLDGLDRVYAAAASDERFKDLKAVSRQSAVMVDIGSGNTKLAYLSFSRAEGKYIPRTYEIPYGTDSFAKRLSALEPEQYKLCVELNSQCEVFKEPEFAAFKDRATNDSIEFFEIYTSDYNYVLTAGGVFWAATKLFALEDGCSPLTIFDRSGFVELRQRGEKISDLYQVMHVQLEDLRERQRRNVDSALKKCISTANNTAKEVARVYSQKTENLKAGVILADWVFEQILMKPLMAAMVANKPIARKSSHVPSPLPSVPGLPGRQLILPSAQNDWLRWKVAQEMGFLPDIVIPGYLPKISRRSRDVNRDAETFR